MKLYACFSLQLTLKSNLRKEFGLDALDMADIVLALQDVFLVKIPQVAITDLFETPLDIVDYMCDKHGVF